MGIFGADLNKLYSDEDNHFDEDDRDTIIHIRHLAQ